MISKSEKAVCEIMKVLTEEYINPFDVVLESNELFNLSSDVPLQCTDVLSCWEIGQTKFKNFTDESISSKLKPFHDPIKKTKITVFKDMMKLTKVSNNGKPAVIEANRNILGKLLAISAKHEHSIDFEIALSYPLTATPLSLSNPDGSRRVTQKSKFVEILSSYRDEPPAQAEVVDTDVLVIDFIAQVRVITKAVPDTFEDLAINLLQSIPKGYLRVDLVADTYRKASIKTAEKNKRGMTSKVTIKSGKSKIPRNFKAFMMNGENKSRLIDIIFDFIINNKTRCLKIVRANMIVLSRDGGCDEVTSSEVRRLNRLSSNQEEADTKVVLHTLDALDKHDSKFHLRSPSADTDILVLCIALIQTPERVYYDSGVGKNRQSICLNDYRVPPDEREALIGFHAVTGNYYTSAFFGKGKNKCWKIMKTNRGFLTAFQEIGNDWELSEHLIDLFEKFVCTLYGSKKVRVNEARYELFKKKFIKENKIIDLSLLPPSLILHLNRCNYVACVWKSSAAPNIIYPSPSQHGWNGEFEIQWHDDIFPADLEMLLLDNIDSDEEYEIGTDEESLPSDDDF